MGDTCLAGGDRGSQTFVGGVAEGVGALRVVHGCSPWLKVFLNEEYFGVEGERR